MSTHAERCARAHSRAAARKANALLPAGLRDRLILRAALDGLDYDGIQARLEQARDDLADGAIDGEGRLQWAISC